MNTTKYGDCLYSGVVNVTDGVKLSAEIKPLTSNGDLWISISKMRKWKQVDQFRHCNTVMISLELFKSQFLPMLNEMCEKVID